MTRTRNVLHIITTLELGGAQKSALSLICGLDPAIYKKYLVSGPEGRLHHEARQLPGVVFDIAPCLRRAVSPWRDCAAVWWLARYMRTRRIDIVHTHSSKAGIVGRLAARIAGVPVVVHTIHGWSFNAYQKFLPRRAYVFLERRAGRWTSKFIAVSQSDITKGVQNGIGTRGDYVLARYGVDKPILSGAAEAYRKEDLGIGASRPVVGVVACFKAQKNLTDMIDAASIVVRAIPEAMFVFVGDGGQRALLERRIARNKLENNFRLLGWREDMDRIFPGFDIAALSSLWEGLPITLLEAMCFGKPVVAYGVDGIPEIVKNNENGFLVRPGNVEELAAKMIELLLDRELRERFGRAGKKLAAILLTDKDPMVARVSEIYTALLRPAEDAAK